MFFYHNKWPSTKSVMQITNTIISIEYNTALAYAGYPHRTYPWLGLHAFHSTRTYLSAS